MESNTSSGRSVHQLLLQIQCANEKGQHWSFDPNESEFAIEEGKWHCGGMKLEALAKEDGKRLWNNVLEHANLEHECNNWFEGKKAEAIWSILHDGWSDCIDGREDEVMRIGPMFKFLRVQKDDWGLEVVESHES